MNEKSSHCTIDIRPSNWKMYRFSLENRDVVAQRLVDIQPTHIRLASAESRIPAELIAIAKPHRLKADTRKRRQSIIEPLLQGTKQDKRNTTQCWRLGVQQ